MLCCDAMYGHVTYVYGHCVCSVSEGCTPTPQAPLDRVSVFGCPQFIRPPNQ